MAFQAKGFKPKRLEVEKSLRMSHFLMCIIHHDIDTTATGGWHNTGLLGMPETSCSSHSRAPKSAKHSLN